MLLSISLILILGMFKYVFMPSCTYFQQAKPIVGIRASLYFFVIYPCALRSSAHNTAPPAAPRTVLWESPTNFQS